MEKILVPEKIIDLGPVDLVIVSQFEFISNVIRLKVYEREHFFINPIPSENHLQIAQYMICSGCFTKAIDDIRDMYAGWSKIDRTLPAEIIGIHNQDPNNLFIQFSLGDRFFIYQRSPKLNIEIVLEELFGKKDNLRQRSLSHEDQQFLISLLRFMPKSKKAICFYPHKTTSRFSYNRRQLSLIH